MCVRVFVCSFAPPPHCACLDNRLLPPSSLPPLTLPSYTFQVLRVRDGCSPFFALWHRSFARRRAVGAALACSALPSSVHMTSYAPHPQACKHTRTRISSAASVFLVRRLSCARGPGLPCFSPPSPLSLLLNFFVRCHGGGCLLARRDCCFVFFSLPLSFYHGRARHPCFVNVRVCDRSSRRHRLVSSMER